MSPEQEVLLSVCKLLADVLPAEWSVERTLEPGTAPARPFALVEQVGPVPTSGASPVQETTMPLAIALYLPEAASRHAALDAAAAIREIVVGAFKYGVEGDRDTTDLVRRWHFTDRAERHRFHIEAAAGTFALEFIGGAATAAVTDIPWDVTGEQLALVLEEELGAEPGDIAVLPRGGGMFDLRYVGALAGVRIGDPVVDPSGLAAVNVDPVCTAAVLLQGAAAPYRGDREFIRTSGFQMTPPLPDQSNPKLVTVGVDVRCTFVRGPRLRSDYRILQRITGRR